MPLLAVYNSVYRYDNICISESFLDSTISDGDNILHMEGYNLIRTDHSDNIKRGGACLYFKKSLPLRKIELSRITECLLCKVNVKWQVGFVIVSYCSPSQTSSQFDDFFSVVSIYVFHQLISEPNHILPNSLSCIDLNSPHLVAKEDISKMGKKNILGHYF